ncbi:MAG: hypothetical protein EZS28_028669 [Streblomastix strix]|uniref:Uncharacterized protein n=1 Tax=Streblomastix strix TaxID=222440 RepID=A0A5J4UZY6_9EUKA|nr:MAG: hypothetical protein EZS28_028669 [Streblomastix strix]
MDHASEYNVDGGLLSLGEFIFLELLSEMELPQDVRQFLILNKKIIKLILHPRYARIIQSISIGFADASCSFAAGKAPSDDGNQQKTVRYWGYKGDLDHITDQTRENQEYANGQRVAVEVDMTTIPRRATFFVDDFEQPNFVIGIPEAIRFWVHTFYKSSFFTVIKFERLIQSTAKGVKGSNALEWGKKWK